MRILYIHNYYQQRGGEDIIVEQDIGVLRTMGYDVKLLAFHNKGFDGSLSGNLYSALLSFYNCKALKSVLAVLESYKPDIVHIHNLFYTASPSIIAAVKSKGIPLVMTLHNYRLVCSSGLLMREAAIPCELCIKSVFPLGGIKYNCFRGSKLQSAQLTFITSLHKLSGLWKQVDRYFVLTEFAKQKFLESSLSLNLDQIIVKPNFVPDLGYDKDAVRKNYFLFVGRLSHEKGINVLIEAAYKGNFPLIIVGDGPMRSLVEKASRDLIHVTVLGNQPREAVIRLMKESRALIFPSIWYEGLPTTLLEAFATGTPVLCSEINNLNQIVTHNYNGILFKSNDSSSLTEMVTTLHNSTKSLTSLGLSGRITYEKFYSEKVVIQKLIKEYKMLISERNLIL